MRHVRPIIAIPIALTVLSFLLVLPALIMGDALSGDSPVHVRWQAHFAEQVWRGTLYPHWLPDMNRGFGSPAFFFYPPLLQWLGALFYPVLPGAGNAMTRLILGIWLVSAAGGMGCWLWLRALPLAPRAAVLGSVMFVLMPYRCFVDIYQRAAVAELAGMCVMPWLFYGATLLKQRRPGGWGVYALSTGVILYSHLPAAMMGIVFASGYVLVLADRRDWRFVVKAVGATLAGFAIGALCVVPALALLPLLTDTTAMFGQRNQPVNWLLFAANGWVDGTRPMTVMLLILGLGMGGVLTVIAGADRTLRGIVLFLAGAIVLVAFLNTAPSRPFWALQTPFSRIQFPFRLLSIHAVALSGLAGIAFHRLQAARGPRAPWLRRLVLLGVPGLLLLDGAMLGVQVYRNRDDRPLDNRAIVATNEDTSEYVLGRMAVVEPVFGAASSHAVSGVASARRLTWESRRVTLAVDATTPAVLALRQFAFTGWECRVDRGEWRAAPALAYPVGVPACAVPVGRHVLEARMPVRWQEGLGAVLTVIGLLLALADMLLLRRAGGRHDR